MDEGLARVKVELEVAQKIIAGMVGPSCIPTQGECDSVGFCIKKALTLLAGYEQGGYTLDEGGFWDDKPEAS